MTTPTDEGKYVLVSSDGVDEKRLPHTEGSGVADYLKAAEITVDDDERVVLNGNPVEKDTTDVVEPGSTIVVTTAVDNG